MRLRGEDGVGSFRSRTLGGVLERRDMIDQELEVDVDTVSRDLLVALVVLISRLLIAAAPMSRLVMPVARRALSRTRPHAP
jgi:hypothetical protein